MPSGATMRVVSDWDSALLLPRLPHITDHHLATEAKPSLGEEDHVEVAIALAIAEDTRPARFTPPPRATRAQCFK